MSKIEDLVIDTIKSRKIKPTSKWVFLFKRIFLSLILLINIVFGALSFSFIIHILFQNEEYALGSLQRINQIEKLIYTLPFIWVIFAILSIIFFELVFKRTEKGYKFEIWKILIINLFICLILGLMLNFSGLTQGFNDFLLERYPVYGRYFDRRSQLFFHPEDGLLIGRLENYSEIENELKILDPNGNKWNVTVPKEVIPRIKSEIRPKGQLRFVGQKVDDWKFIAVEVMQGKNKLTD